MNEACTRSVLGSAERPFDPHAANAHAARSVAVADVLHRVPCVLVGFHQVDLSALVAARDPGVGVTIIVAAVRPARLVAPAWVGHRVHRRQVDRRVAAALHL